VNQAHALRRRAASILLLAPLALTLRCLPKTDPAGVASNVGASGGNMGGAPVAAGAAGSPGSFVGGVAGSGGGAGGAGGAGGSGGAPEPRGPTAATPGVSFPFPQNRQSALCSYPSYRNSDVVAAYQRWKTDTVTSNGAGGHLRVQRPKDSGLEPASTVSEGIGYGMLIAVYMNDQPLFDELWKYEQLWLGKNGLMDWYISSNGNDRLGIGGATDADEDMAWALLMADRQWSTGTNTLNDSYLNIAKKQIEIVYDHEIFEDKLIKPGDTWGDSTTVNVSYFAPSYYRVFAKVSGNDKWNQVLSTSYDTLGNTLNAANGNMSNGLVPAWANSAGAPNPHVWQDMPAAPTNYQYDSCRTPFRIGLDYCANGEPRALAYVTKTSQFFAGVGAKNIVDGYDLNGAAKPQSTSGQSAAFVGPATVGAMSSSSNQAFLQDGYNAVATLGLLVGGQYYDESWTVLSLLMLTGNFVDYTTQTPLVK
jgi:endo-1,4-beta-D-glucanase Y